MNSSKFGCRVILVLGMHRSGTSAITRSLEVLGVNLGDRLRTPRSENPKGFWEDLDFNDINAEVLKHFGLDWHTLGYITPDELRSDRLEPLMSRATDFLRTRLEKCSVLGLKDPRASRILPFWDAVFQRLDIMPCYVIASRNPLCIAESLKARDGFPLMKGVLLWLEYMLGSLSHSSSSPRIVVEYDCVLDDPERELSRMAQALHLPFHPDENTFAEYSNNFLSKSLRSTNFSLQNLLDEQHIPSIIKKLYSVVYKTAHENISINNDILIKNILDIQNDYIKNIELLKLYLKSIEDGEEKTKSIILLQKKITFLEQQIDNDFNKKKIFNFIYHLKKTTLNIKNSNLLQQIFKKTSRHTNSLFLIVKSAISTRSLNNIIHEIRIKLKK